MARRRWIAQEWSGREAALRGAQAEHLARVLRTEAGERCEVATGPRVWLATVTSVSIDEVLFQLDEELPANTVLPLHLLLAIWKFDRFEWAIEKLTELGVARIAPVIARRTEKHLGQAATARVQRWRRIAHEAAQQSRRVGPPVIDDPVSLNTALAREACPQRLLLSEKERILLLPEALTEGDPSGGVAIAVGPEGGWTEEEFLLFPEIGWRAVTLGPRILRAETAAIAATAIAASGLLR